MVERADAALSLVVQAELLGVSRASLYYKAVEPSAAEVRLKQRIAELYTQYPFYGSRRITGCLQREGLLVNRKAVQRHMRDRGIAAIYPGPNLSKRELAHRTSPYLLRGVTATAPDHVWGIEI